MRLEEKRGRLKKRVKSPDLIRTGEFLEPFRVEEVLHPEDLRILREYFQEIVLRGRRYNASEIVSAITLAYGHRPAGFDLGETLSRFYEYLNQETSFGRKEVLQNVLIAYPEERERFTAITEALWNKIAMPEEGPPYAVGPEDMVLLRILKPELQHQIQLAPEMMVEKEEKILKKISNPNAIAVLAQEMIPLLLADPSFKVRIPNVAGLVLDMKKEIARLRHQNTDEAWKNISFLIKGIVLLSADEVGINDKGEIILVHNGQLPPQTSLPERAIF